MVSIFTLAMNSNGNLYRKDKPMKLIAARITHTQQKRIEKLIKEGSFATISDVVRTGLEMVFDKHHITLTEQSERNYAMSRFYDLNLGYLPELEQMETTNIMALVDELIEANINIEIGEDVERLVTIVEKYIERIK